MINAVNSIVATERKMQLDHHIDSLLRTANLKSNRSWTKGYRYLSHSDSVRWQNSYIVKLVPDITAMEFDEFAQVLDAAGCRIIHKLDNVFHGYVIRTENGALPKSVLHRVSEFIETIEEDHIVGTGSSNSNRVQELPKKGFWGFLLRVPAKLWGLDRIDQPYLSPDKRYHYNSTGKGVNVYVVDSGVNFHHAEFEGRAEIVFTSQTLGHSGDGDCSGTILQSIIDI
jgi:subtilisin family serine protease